MQLIPARLARPARTVGVDERHGESEGRPREQRAVCWEIRADTSWGGSGLIPAQVDKLVKAFDTCRLTLQEVARETLPEPTGWIMLAVTQCVKVRDLFIHCKIIIAVMVTSVHLDSFIQKLHFLIMSSVVNNILELNKALGLYYLLKTCEYFILLWFSSLAPIWERRHMQKAPVSLNQFYWLLGAKTKIIFFIKITTTVHQVCHIKQYKLHRQQQQHTYRFFYSILNKRRTELRGQNCRVTRTDEVTRS